MKLKKILNETGNIIYVIVGGTWVITKSIFTKSVRKNLGRRR